MLRSKPISFVLVFSSLPFCTSYFESCTSFYRKGRSDGRRLLAAWSLYLSRLWTDRPHCLQALRIKRLQGKKKETRRWGEGGGREGGRGRTVGGRRCVRACVQSVGDSVGLARSACTFGSVRAEAGSRRKQQERGRPTTTTATRTRWPRGRASERGSTKEGKSGGERKKEGRYLLWLSPRRRRGGRKRGTYLFRRERRYHLPGEKGTWHGWHFSRAGVDNGKNSNKTTPYTTHNSQVSTPRPEGYYVPPFAHLWPGAWVSIWMRLRHRILYFLVYCNVVKISMAVISAPDNFATQPRYRQSM